MVQRQKGLEEYVPLRYSPPSSARRLVPETAVAYVRRACIPAQEFGGWKDGCVGKRGDRAGARRVRLFAIFSSLFCLQTTARDSCVARRLTRTHPCSRIRTVDYFSFAQQRRQAEEYASLRFPLAPLAGTDRLLLFATTGTIAPRYHAYRDLFLRRPIPAQELVRWSTPSSRNSIARRKSTPLCDIPLLSSLARINLLLFATARTFTICLHARTHPCSRI